jgi:hypothetical protein
MVNNPLAPAQQTNPSSPSAVTEDGADDTQGDPNRSDQRASPPSRSSSASCSSWDPEFAQKFETMCAPWADRLVIWAQQLKERKKQPVQYACIKTRRCNGLGDRFSGIFSVFEAALEQHRPVRVLWDGLSEVFEPTCLMADNTWEPQAEDRYSSKCLFPPANAEVVHQYRCGVVHRGCGGPNQGTTIRNFIRACPSDETCGKMREGLLSTEGAMVVGDDALPKPTKATSALQSSVLAGDSANENEHHHHHHPVGLKSGTAAHLFGCAMRAMFQLTHSFRQIEVAWLHNQKSYMMTVNQVEQLMKGYFTISIHLRLGDSAFKQGETDLEDMWGKFQNSFKCAQSVETYVLDMGFNKGLPVRWVFSSDSKELRARVLAEFGDKIMMLDETPKHVSKTRGQTSITAHTMTEWYFLSLADRLIINRRSNNRLFTGRLSGFSKSFWTFQLKHLYYDANTCRLRTMHFDGSWRTSNQQCKKLSTELMEWRLPQPHRKYGDWAPIRAGYLAPSKVADMYSEDALFGPVRHHVAAAATAVAVGEELTSHAAVLVKEEVNDAAENDEEIEEEKEGGGSDDDADADDVDNADEDEED